MPCYKREPSAYTNDLSPSVSVQRSLKLKTLIRLSWYAYAVTCLFSVARFVILSPSVRRTAFPTRFHEHTAKSQNSLRIRAVWSVFAGKFVGSNGSKASSGGHRRLIKLRWAHMQSCRKCCVPTQNKRRQYSWVLFCKLTASFLCNLQKILWEDSLSFSPRIPKSP